MLINILHVGALEVVVQITRFRNKKDQTMRAHTVLSDECRLVV